MGRGDARIALLDAAIAVIRAQGLHATTVDDLCAAAGVSKGAFFHHFDSKDALAVAAAEHWSTTTGAMFAAAPYHLADDPLDRVLGYIDFRASIVQGGPAAFSCLAGTMVQEAFDRDGIRAACGAAITDHAATLVDDMTALVERSGRSDLDPVGLARYTQVVIQGGFVVAKSSGDPADVLDAIAHLRRYIEMLFADGRPA